MSRFLIQVSGFSKDSINWYGLLSWFTPFAIICIIVILINARLMSYAQMILPKDISIIYLVAFICISGIW